MNLRQASEILVGRGWCPIPLSLDAQGLPKKPIPTGWTKLTPASAPALAWESAIGIGVVLGRPSGNLAVIDLDDPDYAQMLFDAPHFTRLVRTVRGRAHAYYIEESASNSHPLEMAADGRTFKLELKTTGTQVAVPPTPGYTLVHPGPIAHVLSLRVAFDQLCNLLGLDSSVAKKLSGYPKPWNAEVTEYRNNNAFIEAHQLREAGMPLALALRHMQIRWEGDYQQGKQTWDEIERTVRSAYRKATGYGTF